MQLFVFSCPFPMYFTDGDLDPQVSKHTLVPLKVAYKKLRLLVDCGCIFIGHGLSKDFRTISLSPSSFVTK